MEYGTSAWATVSKAKTKTFQSAKHRSQSNYRRVKNYTMQSVERYAGIHCLEESREEEVLVHSEKLLYSQSQSHAPETSAAAEKKQFQTHLQNLHS